MEEEREIKITLHINKHLITAIDTELYIDGKWEKAVAPEGSPIGNIFPGWSYVMPLTRNIELQIKMMVRHN